MDDALDVLLQAVWRAWLADDQLAAEFPLYLEEPPQGTAAKFGKTPQPATP